MPKKPASNPKSKAVKKRKAPQWAQPDLFDTHPQVEVTLRIPSGTSITVGTPCQAPSAPTSAISNSEMFRHLGKLSREDIRRALNDARLPAGAIINLATVIHGPLYHLSAIGGKVTKR